MSPSFILEMDREYIFTWNEGEVQSELDYEAELIALLLSKGELDEECLSIVALAPTLRELKSNTREDFLIKAENLQTWIDKAGYDGNEGPLSIALLRFYWQDYAIGLRHDLPKYFFDILGNPKDKTVTSHFLPTWRQVASSEKIPLATLEKIITFCPNDEGFLQNISERTNWSNALRLYFVKWSFFNNIPYDKLVLIIKTWEGEISEDLVALTRTNTPLLEAIAQLPLDKAAVRFLLNERAPSVRFRIAKNPSLKDAAMIEELMVDWNDNVRGALLENPNITQAQRENILATLKGLRARIIA